MGLDVEVAQADLAAAAGGRQPGVLSPFLGLPAPPPGADGRLGGLPGSAAVETLLDPVSVGRLRVIGGAGVVDFVVYRDSAHRVVALQPEGDQVRIREDAPLEDVLHLLGDLVGTSSLVGAPFDRALSPAESLTLAALVDLRRFQVLSGLARSSALPAAVSSTGEVLAAAAAGEEQPMKLAWLVASLTETELDAAHVDSALAELRRLGLVTGGTDGWQLAEDADELAMRTLLPELLVTLTSLTAGTVPDRAGFVAVVSGVRDVLTLQPVEDVVHWQTIPAAWLLDYARAVLGQREVSHWSATHVVCSGGADAYANADDGEPASRLDQRLAVQAAERQGGRVRIICSNTWSAWVDAADLEVSS